MGLIPLLVLIGGATFLKEIPTGWQIVGVLLSLFGSVVCSFRAACSRGRPGEFISWPWDYWVLCHSVCWAGVSPGIKNWEDIKTDHFAALDGWWYYFGLGAVCGGLAGLFLEGRT